VLKQVFLQSCQNWNKSLSHRLLLLLLFITGMQVIYNYIHKTTHVSRVYSVASVLYLQYMLHVMLFCQWNMFCAFTLVLSAVRVQCQILLFYVVPLFRAFPVCSLGIFWTSPSSSIHCNQFCYSTPLFQTPHSSLSIIASSKQTVSIKMIKIMTTANWSVCRK